MQQTPFPYAYSAKIAGVVITILSIISFFSTYYENGTFDLNQLATGTSWGFVFIFFSKEKTDDEMLQSLKFKALTWSIIITFSFTCVFNYLFLYWWFKREHNIPLSVSAFQFFALMLIIATARFYYLKRLVTLNVEE
jgi:hypothetical protein